MSDAMKERINEARERAFEAVITPLDVISAGLESPIEVAMFWGLFVHLDVVAPAWKPSSLAAFAPVIRAGSNEPRAARDAQARAGQTGDLVAVTEQGYVVRIFTQYETKIKGRAYRLDFMLSVDSHVLGVPVPPARLAIECDGHQYHERTKEQAQRDKRRDRDLQSAGFGVARFTGAEIFASPEDAAGQAMELLHSLLERTA